ncbi:patatin-like phospholipase family protein [Mycobacterium sp. MYCO198283]|uniref:patatin-like phospholipase family protein n=1 Tax=Mycobacterium sp. MYCO198283 TaxID=2883505 RepID=UPI001E2C55A5|nr:patatin-like phospholipase family protein [Mycobacterium sp. MYCO198283]MCG5432410.1 patatin-like phospholipase family protein [Mycobacterium sp. MYCO198283]
MDCDVVLSGGGVKGIGLVGALVAMLDAGYAPRRFAGTSAGSIVSAIGAAAGGRLSGSRIRELAFSLPYRAFLDADGLERLPVLGPAQALLRGSGVYRGDVAHRWIADRLAELGVRTFADLAIDDDTVPPEQRYSLVVTVADITTGQLIRLPWDYRRVYDLEPDDQPVADAVRASMSIPFFFRPVPLTNPRTGLTSTLVDGGVLSNFPIDTFDTTGVPRWPTFGVTVLPNLPEGNDKVIPGLTLLHRFGGPTLLERLITTVIVGRDQAYLNQPWVAARTIRVDATKVGFLEFDIGDPAKEALYAAGYDAARTFLQRWDFDAYIEEFRR